MGPKSKIRINSETIMESPGNKDYRDVAEVENNKKSGNCYEECTFEPAESLGRISGKRNLSCGGKVGFVNASRLGCNNLMGNKFEETTESSSSFDDDVSGPESGSAYSDDEFISETQDDATYGGVGEEFRMRNKRLTAHWRTYIQPLMWRCRWVELQIRQLNRLENKLNRELAKCNQNELQQVENCAPDRCASDVPFSGGDRRDKVLKRKKRKRIEDTIDIGTYMSEHNLFSYYEKKKVPANVISSYEKWGNIGFNFNDESPAEDLLFLNSRDGDESFEQVYLKICSLTEHVSKLKIRLDKVTSDIGELSHSDPKSSLVPCNGSTSPARYPASPSIDRDIMRIGSSQNVSQLLAAFNVAEFEEDVLIYNDRMYNGMNGFEDFSVQPAKTPRIAPQEHQGTAGPPVLEDTEMLTEEQPAPKTRSIAQLTDSSIRKSQRGRVPRRF